MTEKRPDWDHYFLSMSEAAFTRSPDKKCKVDCIIVDQNKRIVAMGHRRDLTIQKLTGGTKNKNSA